MYEPKGRSIPNLALLWPAFAAASASEFTAAVAKHFSALAVGPESEAAPEPQWTTANRVALELETVRLRDFSVGSRGRPALLCTPFALHGGALSDLAPGHSLVAGLRAAGLKRLFVADWKSASPEMRFLAIDDYLAKLNVLVDTIGSPVDLIGLCQGGWMALLYACRFPQKVHKLVLAAAPIDIAAAPSALSTLVASSPGVVFNDLVRLGEGLVRGRHVMKFWTPDSITSEDIRELLEPAATANSSAFAQIEARFRAWYSWTFDLPGRYFLEAVDRLYRKNEIAAGSFVALGRRVDLSTLRTPIFLLAARDDELVAREQLFATERHVGTAPEHIAKLTAPCRHLGLFMGAHILKDIWPQVARWLLQPAAPQNDDLPTKADQAGAA